MNYFPKWVGNAGEGFDARGFCEQLSEAGINSVEFVTKDHNGNCYYMTQIGPKPKRDWLGEFVVAAKAREVEVLAYYSLAWDTYAATTYPEWSQRNQDGTPFTTGWRFRNVCPNTPYRKYVIEQIREIVCGYDVDGIWIDLVDWAPCHCECCKTMYRDSYGEELPANPRDTPEHSVRYEEFWGESRLSLIRALVETIRKERPSGLFSFNGSGKFGRYKGQMSALASFHSREGTMGPDFLSRACKSLAPQNKPYEIIAPGGKGWFSWVLRPDRTLKLEAALVCAHGGGLTVSINPFPDGTIQNPEIANVSKVFQWVKERERAFRGGVDATLADVAILWTKNTPRAVFGEAEEGISKTLMEAHQLFEIVQEGRDLSKYQLVILPSGTSLLDQPQEQVREFVKNGGGLLCISTASLMDGRGELLEDFSISDILGTKYAGILDESASYLRVTDRRLSQGLTDYPLLVRSPALKIHPTRCDVLAEALLPIAKLDNEHWVWPNVVNPPNPEGRGAAVTLSLSGRCAYVSSSIDKYVAKESAGSYLYDPWPRKLLSNLMEILVKDPLLRTDAPAGVEILLRKSDDGYLVHAFNKYSVLPGVSDLSRNPTIKGVNVWLNPSRLGRVHMAESLAGEGEVKFDSKGEWPVLHICRIDIHTCVAVR